MTRQRILIWASGAFVAANVLHTLDHLRQGTERLTAEVFMGGTVISLLALVTLVLVVRDDPRAPLVAAVVGLWTAFGVAASHVAPHWSAFSDPYPDLSVDALSWTVMLAEVTAALALGVVGLRQGANSWLSTSTSS
jgi:hypothetical protein